ncbi:lipoyl(octanoyl) transferase LipB [Candidatus Bipolaricaulota bacterium]|nr:lipoyl(octanoyl) transferase LipB [Candidatus Bipolaricaulota bacterium]
MKTVLVLRLGRAPYGPVLAWQRRLHRLRREEKIPNILLSLEHEPVVTLGRSAKTADLLLSEEERERLGVEVYLIERGGAATYHGPGQLVLYPILNLRTLGLSLRQYVEGLEKVMIRVGKALGVELFRRPGYPGAWHELGKVGFVGVHVQGWVSFHGLALNVNLNPNGFQWIVPCGMADLSVVSLSDLLGRPVEVKEVEPLALAAFSEVFGVDLVELSGKEIRTWLNQLG